MEDAAVFFLCFDSRLGPQIVSSIGHVDFTDMDFHSLRACSFPDSGVPPRTESILFISKIRKYFCYTIFTMTADPSEPRGYRQVSFVIATECPYIYPFTRILHSSMLMSTSPPDDLLLVISEFVSQAVAIFRVEDTRDQQIPTFDGGLAVAMAESQAELLGVVGGIGWNPRCKTYFLNCHYLDVDLMSALSVRSLIEAERTLDLVRLWEAAVVRDSVMVFAPNPTMASSAVLAIASLTYPEAPHQNVIPFLAVTDPRFEGITRRPGGMIVGFSNPIALQRAAAFDLVFTTGVNSGRNGLGTPRVTWGALSEKVTSGDLRQLFYAKNSKVAEAVRECLADLRKKNPYAAFVGEVNADALAAKIAQKGVGIGMVPRTFAVKLLRSALFSRVWKEERTQAALAGALSGFAVERLCVGMKEKELIDLYSMLAEVRKAVRGVRELEMRVDGDLGTITMHLSPDLILAPHG
jgi:hypothetical protein